MNRMYVEDKTDTSYMFQVTGRGGRTARIRMCIAATEIASRMSFKQAELATTGMNSG